MLRAVAFTVLVVGIAAPGHAQDAEVARLLAEARQALGVAVQPPPTSLSFSGRWSQDMGARTLTRYLDVYWTLPDKFVRVMLDRSGPIDITYRQGFNGDGPIREVISPFPTPSFIPAGPQTPESRLNARRIQVFDQQRWLAFLSLALFAAPPDVYPLSFAYAGLQDVNGARADAFDATGPDGRALRLYVDATTHLPVMVTWKEKMMVMTTTSSLVAVRNGQVVNAAPSMPTPPPPSVQAPPGAVMINGFPTGDPTAGLPDVEHQLIFDDYRKAGAMVWPHRLREMVDGRLLQEARIDNFKLNPKISDDKFKVVEK